MLKKAVWLSLSMLGGVAGCSGRNAGPADSFAAKPSEPDPGARIFGMQCIACHQQDARGIPGVYPSLVGSPVVLGDPSELALWVLKGQRPASLPTGRYSTVMLQFGWMKPAAAAALLTYIRTHFGNTASAVDADTVARALDQPP